MATHSFDPLSPSTASGSAPQKDHTTFRTLTRERQNRHPPIAASDVPALDELVAPHLDSFNALVEDGQIGKGLLQLGVEDIGEKTVFDGQTSERRPWGNKITCKLAVSRADLS
jgi:DNA-directed RNA polymerase I subunit RPA2